MVSTLVSKLLVNEMSWGLMDIPGAILGTVTMTRSRPTDRSCRLELEINGGPFFFVSGALEDEFRTHLGGMGIVCCRVGYNNATDTATWRIDPWEAS